MEQDITVIRDSILTTLLPDIIFDGWTWEAVEKAAARAGHDPSMALAVFPERLDDAIAHFSDWADREMMARLDSVDPNGMRVRDRIRAAVACRLEVLGPWKEAVRMAVRYRAVPHRLFGAGRMVWRTADRIWDWAGDTATDYNRYTKRTLLSGVLASTLLAWLSKDESGLADTLAFLDRRIENVMRLGGILGKIRKPARRAGPA